MSFLTEVHGLTPEIRAEIRRIVGKESIGFGVDSDGLVYVYGLNEKLQSCRYAEGWYWQDVIEELRRQYPTRHDAKKLV